MIGARAAGIINPAFPNSHTRTNPRRRSVVCRLRVRCKSNNDGDSDSDSGSKPEGDPNRQELLAKIAMIQAQKLRLTDYLDERSAFLTQFAEEANAEIDAIGENALKDLDEASNRIMENIESKMQAFEESMEMNKQETEMRDKELEDFEGEIEKGRNEGMFFQSFQKPTPEDDKATSKEEISKIRDVTSQNVGSETRRNVYLGLTALLAVSIADSFVSSSPPNLVKVAVLGAIFVGLLSQLIKEQNMLSENEKNKDGLKKEQDTK